MSEQETLRMAAEVVDRFSSPLRDFTRQLQAVNKLSQQQQKEGVAGAKEQVKWFRELHQTTHKLSDEVKGSLTPAMAAFGIGSLSVASAIAAVTKSVIDFGANARNLSNLSRFSGFSADAVRGLENVSEGLGSTKADMDTFIKSFSTNMDQWSRLNRGALASFFATQASPQIRQFGLQLKNAGTQAERMNLIFGFLASGQWSDVQKKILTDAIGLPEAFAHAGAGAKQLYETINKEIKPLDPGWEARARQYNASIALLQTSLGNLALHIGDDMSGSFAHVADIVRKFIDENGPQIEKFFGDIGKWLERANWTQFGADVRDTSHDIAAVASGINKLVESTVGWKTTLEFFAAYKVASILGITSAVRGLATSFGLLGAVTLPAWIVALMAGGGAYRLATAPGESLGVTGPRSVFGNIKELWGMATGGAKPPGPAPGPAAAPEAPALPPPAPEAPALPPPAPEAAPAAPAAPPPAASKTWLERMRESLFHKTGYYTKAAPGQGDMGRADPVPSDSLMMGMVSAASPGSPLSVGALAGKIGSALSAQIKSMHVVPAAEAADGIKKMAFTTEGPNPLRAAQSSIKFPTEETLGGSKSTADAVETIAVGTRKGVYDGMWDFYNSYKAVGGAAAPGGGVLPASLGGGGEGAPLQRGGGALPSRSGGEAPLQRGRGGEDRGSPDTGPPVGTTTIPPGPGGPGQPSKGDPRGMLSAVRQAAISHGINPDLMERVARGEGLGAYTGDGGTSFGAMQLHRGGAGSVGTEYEKATGHSLTDRKYEPEQIDFAAKWIKHHGWAAWSAARNQGITGKMGVGIDTSRWADEMKSAAPGAAPKITLDQIRNTLYGAKDAIKNSVDQMKGHIAPGAETAVGGAPPKAFIMHHTGGRGTVEGVQNTLRQRGLGVEYVMDRDGNIVHTGGPGSANILPGYGPKGQGLNNSNIVGMEVIANDDKDVTKAQIAAAQAFIKKNYPNTPVFGHGEVNPGHKEADEGLTITNAIRQQREAEAARSPSPGIEAAKMAQDSAALHGAALRDHFGHREQKRTDLLDDARKAGMAGTMTHKVKGDAAVNINLSGFPRGTTASTAARGIFSNVKLDRGRIPRADTEA